MVGRNDLQFDIQVNGKRVRIWSPHGDLGMHDDNPGWRMKLDHQLVAVHRVHYDNRTGDYQFDTEQGTLWIPAPRIDLDQRRVTNPDPYWTVDISLDKTANRAIGC